MSKFDKLFDIPEELSSDIAKITILGFNRMLIENYKAILEYQDFFVFLSIAFPFGRRNINIVQRSCTSKFTAQKEDDFYGFPDNAQTIRCGTAVSLSSQGPPKEHAASDGLGR